MIVKIREIALFTRATPGSSLVQNKFEKKITKPWKALLIFANLSSFILGVTSNPSSEAGGGLGKTTQHMTLPRGPQTPPDGSNGAEQVWSLCNSILFYWLLQPSIIVKSVHSCKLTIKIDVRQWLGTFWRCPSITILIVPEAMHEARFRALNPFKGPVSRFLNSKNLNQFLECRRD